MSSLRWFFSVFPPKPSIFGHIFGVSFDHKCIKIKDILIFITENRTAFPVLLLNHPMFEKTELK